MKLYFQAGRNKRVAIDTEKKTWTTDFYWLGPWHHYISISAADYKKLLQEIDFNGYNYEEQFR